MAGRIDRANLENAFDRMGMLLAAKNVRAEIAVYGGSAIMLQFEARESTNDVDCVVVSGHGAVIEAMQKVGRELSLGSGWLNEGVSIYTSRNQVDGDMLPYGQYPKGRRPHLIVSLAKPEYLMAMKVEAFRRATVRDVRDAEMLARGLGLTSVEEMFDVHSRYFDPGKVTAPMRQVARGVMANLGREEHHGVVSTPKPR